MTKVNGPYKINDQIPQIHQLQNSSFQQKKLGYDFRSNYKVFTSEINY